MAKSEKWVRGSSTDEKFTSIARNMEKFARRLKTTTAFAALPFPVSHYVADVPVDKVIFRYVFVAAGKITKVVISVAEKSGDNVEFEARLTTGEDTMIKKLTVVDQQMAKLDIQVDEGSTLSISCSDGDAKGIHFGLLWNPSANAYNIERYLIDELEAAVEEPDDA